MAELVYLNNTKMAKIVLGIRAQSILEPIRSIGKGLGDGIKKSDIESLRRELEMLNRRIDEAERRLEQEESVKALVKQMREVAELIEDVLDRYVLVASQTQGFASYLSRAGRLISILSSSSENLASNLRNIKLLLGEIKERGERYNMSERVTGDIGWNESHHRLVSEEFLIGIDYDVFILKEWLVRGELETSVISVLGPGGIGKTTLAEKVYDNEAVGQHFPYCAWIAVSNCHDILEFLKFTVKQISPARSHNAREIDSMSVDELVSTLRQSLQSRRYLLVFDDVWNEEIWQFVMRHVLPDDNMGSRIIVTARSNVLGTAYTDEHIHRIHMPRLLSEEISLELFYRIVFCGEPEQRCPQELVQLSFEIVRKCKGLPLAIVTIAGLLSTKEKIPQEWRKLLDNLTLELESNASVTGLSNVLVLSFLDLPRHLKLCFLYFGMFPKESLIPNEKLFKLWIAEGFLQEKTGKTLEEVAEEYLKELVHRNLVQACEGYYGIEKFCRVRSLMYEIACKKAGERDFFVIFDAKGLKLGNKGRRLLISNNTVERVWESAADSEVRSVFMSNVGALKNSDLNFLFTKYKLLTLLEIENSPLELLPKEVGNLLCLKYLSLKNTKLKRLPKSIGKLQKLQTLELISNLLVELPKEIFKLENLRHLLASCCNDNVSFASTKGVKINEGIGRLGNLQTLMIVDAELSGINVIQELKKLRQLRSLSISRLNAELARPLCAYIEDMSHLVSLNLYSKNKDDDLDLRDISSIPPSLERLVLKGLLRSFPEWISRLGNLSVLCLSLSRLSDDPLEHLCHLPSLESLWLYQAYEGVKLCFQERGFEKLKLLVLREMHELEVVEIEKGALSSLEELRIGPSPCLHEVPLGIWYLSSLKVLSLYDMPNELVLGLQPDGGSDYGKIEHVPSVLFWYRVGARNYISYRLGDLGLLDHLQGLPTSVNEVNRHSRQLSFSYSDDEEGSASASTSILRFDGISRSSFSSDRFSVFSDDIEDS